MLATDVRFEAVFISDLHLHPNEPLITHRFNTFIDWASAHTNAVYILGDFFHVWAGDDGLEPWSQSIAKRLHWLSQKNISIYFMHGNRDFLLGRHFADLAGLTFIPEPSVIQLDQTRVLLVHGDRYCTRDKSHQLFRRLTRNRWMMRFFLVLPRFCRAKIAHKIRQYSQSNKSKKSEQMDVVVQPMIKQMQQLETTVLIHGHIHKPGLTQHACHSTVFNQFVLSDWDENPSILCYDKTNGFKYNQINF